MSKRGQAITSKFWYGSSEESPLYNQEVRVEVHVAGQKVRGALYTHFTDQKEHKCTGYTCRMGNKWLSNSSRV